MGIRERNSRWNRKLKEFHYSKLFTQDFIGKSF
jgi:hypothetical protein